jgi:prepilin-type N-terminal cleavage/methylation domain-containing protein
MKQHKKGVRAFTFIEVIVAMSLLGIVVATVGPTFRKSSVSTQGAALSLAAALTEARQQAITQQIPVAVVIPSDNGNQGQADTYYIASGEQPRITQVKSFGAEQPDLRFMVGHWPLDTGKLQNSTLTTTITPPPEATFESDLDVSLWNLTRPKDFAFIFTPRGKLVTNGLPHFDGAYHILVSHGGKSSAAAAPGASGLPAATSPDLFSPTQVGSPYTVTISPAGTVAVTSGVVGAPDGASYIGEQAQASAAAAPATVDAKPTTAPVVTTVSVLPDPAALNLPAGVDMLLDPTRHMTITTRATSPERVPLFCQWTASGGGGVSSAEPLRMTYRPASGEWESTWHWKAPDGAAPGDRFTIQGRVRDGQGNESPAHLSSGVDPIIQVGDPSPRIAFYSGRFGFWEILAMNTDRSGMANLTNNSSSDDHSACWSPDGKRIAFTRYSGGNNEIYVMNADGSGQTNLTNSPSSDRFPSWSHDGSRIAFESDRDGNGEIYVMNADGSGQTNLTNTPQGEGYPFWSPAAGRIAFCSNRDGNLEIYVMDANGSGQTRLTNNPTSDVFASWSADGARLAFTSGRDGNDEIYVMTATGLGQTRITNNPAMDNTPCWLPDGSIGFCSRRDGNPEIYLMNADGSGQTRLTNHPATDEWPTAR